MADRTQPGFDLIMKAWKAHYANAGIPAEEIEEDFDRSLKTVSFVPETVLLDILTDAGYRNIQPFYGALLFSGWLCFKAEDTSKTLK